MQAQTPASNDRTPTVEEAQQILERLSTMAYRNSAAEHAVERGHDVSCSFDRFVLGTLIDGAEAFNSIMSRHLESGGPCGEEYRSGKDARWAFVLPDVDRNGGFRLALFDEDGMSGHRVHKTLELAVEDMVNSGFQTWDHGRLDVVSARPRWARGVLIAVAHQRMNAGTLTFAQYAEESRRIYEEAAAAVAAAGDMALT